MNVALNESAKTQMNMILDSVSEALDITETQYNALVTSYNAVGEYLSADDFFSKYEPVISPQGSLRLGTIIQPVNPDDDLDVDLVFRLYEKPQSWTQKDLKERVGNLLKISKRYSRMLDTEGKRCWTLLYRDNCDNPKEKYHMDILPSVVDKNYNRFYDSLISNEYSYETIGRVALRITDTDSEGYETNPNLNCWLKSNPDGYAIWFSSRCKCGKSELDQTLTCSQIVPIDSYQRKKTVLQRIVQILKRHRDIMFSKDTEDKPISIIITTLAAQSYKGESEIVDGLMNIVHHMKDFIVKESDGWHVDNPVNHQENFAEKWMKNQKLQQNFFKWLDQVEKDVDSIVFSKNLDWQEKLKSCFGERISQKSVALYGEKFKRAIASGAILLDTGGTMKANIVGKVINTTHNFYGK